MKQLEGFLIKFLNRVFVHANAFRQGDELFQEMDAYVDSSRKRRPDLSYFTSDQIITLCILATLALLAGKTR